MSPSLIAAYAHCRRIVAARAKNFMFAFWLLPAPRRRGLEAIYAYCRLADDFADDDAIPTAERARRLADLRARLRHVLPQPGDPPAPAPPPDPELDPLMAALADTARRFGVRRGDLDLIAIGCEQDLTVTRYERFEDLERYCYMVASAVGLACLDVFGYRGDPEAVRQLAVDLGLAMQLTNIIRDVQEDLDRDRVYLPQEDLRRFGISEDQLRQGTVDQAWRDFLDFQIQRARRYFHQGAKLAPWVRPSSRICPLALASIYSALLDHVERADHDVFRTRVRLPTSHKLGLLALCLGQAIYLAPGRSPHA